MADGTVSGPEPMRVSSAGAMELPGAVGREGTLPIPDQSLIPRVPSLCCPLCPHLPPPHCPGLT